MPVFFGGMPEKGHGNDRKEQAEVLIYSVEGTRGQRATCVVGSFSPPYGCLGYDLGRQA